MAENSTFKLFSVPGELDFFYSSSEASLPPPAPPVEVLSSEVSSTLKCSVEPVNLDGHTLFKGWVSTKEVFGLPNSDLVAGVYEGGLKLWESSLDLVKALRSEVQNGHLSFIGKRVVEDFYAEVLRSLTIPNVNVNLSKELPFGSDVMNCDYDMELRFFAGDWSQIHQCLLDIHGEGKDLNYCSEQPVSGYDIILIAETIYPLSAQQSLYRLIKKCLYHPNGVVYMAAKKYYFGVGEGTWQFLSMVEKDGDMAASLVTEVADGSSNVREALQTFCIDGLASRAGRLLPGF